MTDAGIDEQENEDLTTLKGEEAQEAGSENNQAKEPAEDWKNRAVYLAAEMENMKKRFEREKQDFLRYANEELLKKMLPVMDNLFLAISSVKKSEEGDVEGSLAKKVFESLHKGVEMTLKQFEQTLQQNGVEFIDSVGQDFNPELHEAMGQTENPDFEDGKVASEFQKGIKLNGRVIRPAKVIVNKVSSSDEAQNGDGE